MVNPNISIAIPAYNGEKYLKAALESALNQNRSADEIILIDDASTDATAEIAKSYASKIKYYFNDKATGFVDAWNRAIHKTSGDYIAILHQDDLLYPDYLRHIEAAITTFPQVRHFYTACHYIDSLDKIIKEPPLPHSLQPVFYSGAEYAHNYLIGVMSNNHIHRCPGVTTRKSLLMNECTYRKEAGQIADDDFFYRVGHYTNVAGISFPLAGFRLHAESQTAQIDLIEKLASCYIFQSLERKNNDSVFSDDDKQLIYRAAVKYINEFLFYRLLDHDAEGIAKALKNAEVFEEFKPGFIRQHLSAWAKLMWRLTENNRLWTSYGYVYSLDLIKRLREAFIN